MSQSRRMSLLETITNVVVGFLLSLLASFFIYPFFGHSFSLSQNLGIIMMFTVISLLRGYVLRRCFNMLGKPS